MTWDPTNFGKSDSRWWQLKYFSCSPLYGEDFQFDEHIFQMGWFNHQLVMVSEVFSGSFLGGWRSGSAEHVLGVAADLGGSLCVRILFFRSHSGMRFFCQAMFNKY